MFSFNYFIFSCEISFIVSTILENQICILFYLEVLVSPIRRKVVMVMEPPLASSMELFDSFDPFLVHFSGFSMLIEKLFSIHVVWTLLSGSVPKSICNSTYLNKDYGSLVILITNYS